MAWMSHKEQRLVTLHNCITFRLVDLWVRCYAQEPVTNAFDFNRFFLVTDHPGKDGGYFQQIGGRRFILKRHGVYFMPNARPYHFAFKHGLELICCHFHLYVVPGFDLLTDQPPAMQTDRPFVTQAHALLKQPLSAQQVGKLRAMLLGRAAQHVPRAETETDRAIVLSAKYAPLLRHLAQSASAATTVGELAEVMGLNRDQLSRGFARDFGVPLKRYLSRLVIERAQALLSSGEPRIRDVAEQLGFSSEYYFSRFFKKHVGQTPSDFRAQSRHL